MGKSEKICEMTGFAEAELLLVSVTAEIHPLLQDVGLGLDGGLVIFAETPEGLGTLWQYFVQMGAVRCKGLTVANQKITNNKIGIHMHRIYDREAEALRFLDEEGFTPAIFVHSLIPDFLRDVGNLIVFEGYTDFQLEFAESIVKFTKFIHEKPEFAQDNIVLFKSSDFYSMHKWDGRLNIALGASAEVFYHYYRLHHSEAEAERIRRHLHDTIGFLAGRAECYSGEWDNLDAVRTVVEAYLDRNLQIQIGDKNMVEGELAEANQIGEAILWDENLYYFPENLLKQACRQLSDVVSFLEIKRELCLKGYLCCNNVSGGNYTVKRTIVNAFGYKTKQRFLLIKREFFDREGEMTLPERRDAGCTSGLLMENPAQ